VATLRPLAGIRVVELDSTVSVAFAARLLADLGAEVVKVEPPEGDPLRRQGPYLPGGRASALFGYLNHGKRSLAVDPGSAPDAALLADLVRGADLLLWAAEGCVATPLPPASLVRAESRERPAIVAVTAYGTRGPRAGRGGTEFVAQHAGGYAWHQACPVTDPEATPPLGCVDHEAALLVGLVAANAALWGMAVVSAGGAPPFVDLSAEDVFAWMLVDALADLHGGVLPTGRGRAPGREITIAGGLVWFLPCIDGAILVSPREDHQWRRWVELMGSPAWADDEALCGSRAARTTNAAALQTLIAEWSRHEHKREVFERAQAARVACFPASTAGELVANRQLRARGFFRSLGGDGGTAVPGLPFLMRSSGGAALPRGGNVAAPALDEARAELAAQPRVPRHPRRGAPGADEAAKRPLTGLRVADFSWVVAGPMATKALGALGAEIIKIESTVRPEFAYRDGWFAVVNNNKRSCTLDITRPEGQALARGIVVRSDVVVENFSSRVLTKNSLGHDDLAKLRPGLIFVSASGLGREGPERDLLAYGSLLQAYSGRVALTGRMNPRLEAMGVMPAWTDPVTSLWESLAILAALHHRRATGEGAYIDLSMLEATVALLPDAMLHAALGHETGELGSEAEIGAAPSGCFRCAGEDAWIALSVRNDTEWAGLCRAIGRVDLLDDAAFMTAVGRQRAKPLLDAAVAAWCRARGRAEAEAALQAHRVPAAPSRGIRELVEDAHLRERGVFRRLDEGGWTITLPWADAEGWRGHFSPTPALGADNGYVLHRILGLSEERQRQMAEAGAVR
jgi:crotonobetainyl-CoA:carnitine CoA-transferase CaiB-like acyl-CoA transferase